MATRYPPYSLTTFAFRSRHARLGRRLGDVMDRLAYVRRLLRALCQIAQRDNTYNGSALVHHRQTPDLLLSHQISRPLNLVLRPYRHDFAGHALLHTHLTGIARRRD